MNRDRRSLFVGAFLLLTALTAAASEAPTAPAPGDRGILLTAIQSLDHEQKEAARMDGAGPIAMFFFIILPHLGRAISVVVMIQTIFFLTIFAEIFVTTSGGPGLATTNLAFLIYIRALLEFDVGGASAGGVIAIILANIVAIFLVRTVARNLDE